MKQRGQRLYNALRGSLLHPQWLSDRFHMRSRQSLRALRDSRILDIGSGNSHNIAYLHASNSIIRLDYPAINRRYELRPDIFGDACCLPVVDDAFDAIFLFEVLEHVGAPERAIREIRRALQPRGKLFVSVPFVYPIHDAPYDFQRFTIHGIRHLLQTLGFEVVQIVQHGNSLLVPMQLFNLGLLEGCRAAWQKNPMLGLAAVITAYPVCLLNNLLALPLTLLPDKGASCFGYFMIAECA